MASEMFKKILYSSTGNRIVRTILKPFAIILPSSIKFPITGVFKVKGKNIPSFKLETNATSAVTKYLYWGNVEGFEFEATKVFCILAKKSKVFFDIGSNIGYYSFLGSAVTKDNIKCYAFEPMPSAFSFLLKNIELNENKNIFPQKLALSDRKGHATFYAIRNEKFPHLPQLTGDGSLNKLSSDNTSKINFEVEINTLDNFVLEHLGNEKIDLMKLDTEANEDKVLAGAHKVLAEHRPIIQCEILKNQIESRIESVLAPYNYRFYRATSAGLKQVDTFLDNTSRFQDYYLVPFEKTAMLADLNLLAT